MASPASRPFSPAHATELLDHVAAQIRRTLQHPDERRVHDLRVAIRRFTQVLSILKPCLVPENYKDIRKILKQIMSQAGEVRNFDITLKLLLKMQERPPSPLGRQRRAVEKALLAELQSWLAQDLKTQWHIQLGVCATVNAATARKWIRQAVADAASRVHKRAKDVDESMKALHKLRIATKKLRYTLELAGAPIDTIKDLQTQLGDINDFHTARAVLKRIEGASELRKALAKKQRKKVRRFRHQFREPSPLP